VDHLLIVDNPDNWPLKVPGVEVVAAKIREIAVAAKGQSKRADQIQEALHVFREVTLQSSRRAEQTGATVRELSEHAESLEQEIGRFRL